MFIAGAEMDFVSSSSLQKVGSHVSDSAILVINAGSSSLKFGIYNEGNREEQLLLSGVADGIGRSSGTLELLDDDGRTLRSEKCSFATQQDALSKAAHWIAGTFQGRLRAIGHRVVHGGPHLIAHQRITGGVLQELRKYTHFAPLHIPLALQLIERAERIYPQVPQFACFDTAFHHTIPEVAARFPLPRELYDEGIRRYGFHGLSYESIIQQMGSGLPHRTVIAHLGNGASLAAICEGRSIDTTMGLTPTGGIPMGSRSGDLDPGVLLYLLRTKCVDTDSLEALLNHNAGLKALSGGMSDMRDIEAAAAKGTQEAQLAIELFCTSIRKTIAAYAAILGGLDMLVFSGGIGEHSVRVRSDVCRGLAFLGFDLDDFRNESHYGTISTDTSKVQVCVVASEEDLMIARHCRAIMRETGISQLPHSSG
jgi:acetate kinase